MALIGTIIVMDFMSETSNIVGIYSYILLI